MREAKYPDLRVLVENGQPVIRGTFSVEHDGDVLDRFVIEARFPRGLAKPPMIWETGGRIPRTLDRHTFTNGSICVEVPELVLLQSDYSLVGYLDGPVRNYFIGQSLVEKGHPWPFGERAHNKDGLLEAYGEMLNVSAEAVIRQYLWCLSHPRVKGHWQCPCGGGKRIRDCHASEIRVLSARIPAAVAGAALKRLDVLDSVLSNGRAKRS